MLILSLSFIFSEKSLRAQPTNQTFNSSGTYTVPSGYSANVTIEAWGAGGGGGSNTTGPKGGGGSGSYASSTTTIAAGNYTVTVGTGGSAGSAGTNSSFTTIVIAESGGSTAGITGGTGGTTGGSTGTILIAGTAGSNTSGNTGGNGGTGANGGGAGGIGATNNNSGTNATPYGGGGGGKGGGTGNTSGIGANGRVIVTVTTVLPVKLSNIKAYEKLSGIQLDWTAYSETNLSHYEIERSADGRIFISIGQVNAFNSVLEKNYGFFDANPLPGTSFYRLKNIDLDNKFEYSSIIRVSLDKSIKDIRLYPIPVTGNLISFQGSDLAKGNYTARIFNAAGQQVYLQHFSHTGGSVTQTLQLPAGVKSGMYTLQLGNEGVKVMNKSFVVQ